MTDLVERLTAILSERRLPGTRNGPITEPRDLAIHIAAKLEAPEPKPEVKPVQMIGPGIELEADYRGFQIGRAKGSYASYKNGETFSLHALPSAALAQREIDRVIMTSFDHWFARYKECRVEAEIANEPSRDTAAAGFHAQRTPEDVVQQEASKANHYKVEKQQDGTHAIFNRGGFIGGGYASYDRELALDSARELIEADIECGVPVIREVV